jgi:hypothetical protein
LLVAITTPTAAHGLVEMTEYFYNEKAPVVDAINTQLYKHEMKQKQIHGSAIGYSSQKRAIYNENIQLQQIILDNTYFL